MRKILLILSIFLFQKSFAQHPTPLNFDFSYYYIMLDEEGECEDEMVNGPYYCSFFQWDTPDMSGTTATLDHYNIYVSDMANENVTIIATTTETSYEMGIGVIGHTWVTAVYTEPEGESEPSNIVINESLPIGLDETPLNSAQIYYNSEAKEISVLENRILQEIKLFDMNGKVVKVFHDFNSVLSVAELKNGVYIIEITSKSSRQRYKIVI